jgi:hypothetical protein
LQRGLAVPLQQFQADGEELIMAGLPWYLLALGIILVVVGTLLAGLGGGSASNRAIDPRMKDEDIARLMNRGEGNWLANTLVLLGLVLIAVSVVWRIVRIFV